MAVVPTIILSASEDSQLYQNVARQLANLAGTPYKHHGRNPGEGLDCLGLIQIAFVRLYGKILPDYEYEEEWHEHLDLIMDNWSKYVTRVETVTPGDLLFIAFDEKVQHLGIYLGQDKIIHAMKRHGVTISSFSKYQRFIKFAGRP